MGILNSLPDGPIRSRLDNGDKSLDEITLADLRDQYGEGVLARGLSYMESLSEADENYREAAEDQYTEGLKRMGVELDEEAEEEVDKAWKEGMKESGIGVDDG